MAISSDWRQDRSQAAVQLSSSRGPAALTAAAWVRRVGFTVADWLRQGRWLATLERASGDWVRYGARTTGTAAPAAPRDCVRRTYVASRFDVWRRRDSLSVSHHAAPASLGAEEDLWLRSAEAGALSLHSLRSELRQTRHRQPTRAAVAAARRERDAAVVGARLQAAMISREAEPHTFANSTAGQGSLATRKDPRQTRASRRGTAASSPQRTGGRDGERSRPTAL